MRFEPGSTQYEAEVISLTHDIQIDGYISTL